MSKLKQQDIHSHQLTTQIDEVALAYYLRQDFSENPKQYLMNCQKQLQSRFDLNESTAAYAALNAFAELKATQSDTKLILPLCTAWLLAYKFKTDSEVRLIPVHVVNKAIEFWAALTSD